MFKAGESPRCRLLSIPSQEKSGMRTVLLACLVALALVATPLPAAQNMAYVYAVHGIPGANGFPVDIAVDGVCAVQGFTFGNVGGPLSLEAGARNVRIYASNTMMPCSGAPALEASPFLAAGNTYALVAHLTEAGVPTVTGFELDLSKTTSGTGRFILHHTAAAPCVDVDVARNQGRGRVPSVSVPGFCNGTQVPAEFRPGNWQATLSVDGNSVFGPTQLNLQPNTAQLIFAVGVFPDSFTYIVKTVPTAR